MPEKREGATLHQLDLGKFDVTVRGISPLIVNRFTERSARSITAPQTGVAKRGKEPRVPKQEYEEAFYRTANNKEYGIPGIAFKKSMVRAAKGTEIAMTDARNSFFIVGPELLPLHDYSTPLMREDRVVFGRGTTGVAYRPMFEQWHCTLTVEYNRRRISAEQIINLLQLAGWGVGIGAWRPANDGIFGRFEVVPNGKKFDEEV